MIELRFKKDKIHYNTRKADIYNKPFNIAIGPREPGKSTAILTKIYKMFIHHKRPSIILKRMTVEITESDIEDTFKVINKFLDDNKKIKPIFKTSDIKNGFCDVYISKEDKEKSRVFIRYLSLSVPITRQKGKFLENVAFIYQDECLINPLMNEKYLPGEFDKIKEIYNTYQRENRAHHTMLKCWFTGNPYTKFSPVFIGLGIPINKMTSGAFLVGETWTFEAVTLSEELKEDILKNNPLYKFDDSYTRYAFDGSSIADERYIIEPQQPLNFGLKYVFRISNRYLLVWRNKNLNEGLNRWWCSVQDEEPEANRNIYAIDFNNLISNTRLITPDVKFIMMRFKSAVATRGITYQSIECGYYIEQLYNLI